MESTSQKRKAEPVPTQTPAQPQSQLRDEDSDDYFDNTQDEVKDELYVSLPAKVVGLQYYKGEFS